VSPNCFFTFIDDSLPTKFPRFWSAVPAQHTFPPSSDVDCERSPALDLDPLPIDDLAGGDGAAAALGAYLDRDTGRTPAPRDDPGELGNVVGDLGHNDGARPTLPYPERDHWGGDIFDPTLTFISCAKIAIFCTGSWSSGSSSQPDE
jgi:hypothetical protein